MTNIAYSILSWGFVAIFTILMVVMFGLALSRLEDAGVIGVGVVALAASVVAVVLQGIQVRALLDKRDARDTSGPSDLFLRQVNILQGDRFLLRSYSLMVRPDLMNSLRSHFSSDSLAGSGVHLSERAFIKCGNTVSRGEVSYAGDVNFLVVSKGATSENFRTDVMDGHVSSIMFGGGLLRIISLTGIDFANDDNNIAGGIATGNDIYLVSARGSKGSVPINSASGCSAVDTFLPWSSVLTRISASDALTELMVSLQAGVELPIQVWGVGGR